VPFHLHRDERGKVTDGIEVLSGAFETGVPPRVPILMPVSAFSQHAAFPRRLETLRKRCPRAIERLIVMRESEIESDHVRRDLQRSLSAD